MDPVDGIDLGCRQVCHNIDAVKQAAGKFFEVLNLANLVHFIQDSVQDGFDFLVRFLLEEGPLALQTALVAKKLFLVEVGNPLLFYSCSFHEVPHYTPKFR